MAQAQDSFILIGHSYIRWLRRFCEDPLNWNLGLQNASCLFIGYDDVAQRKLATIQDIENYVQSHQAQFMNTSACLIEAGTNDAQSALYQFNPEGLRDHVLRVAELIKTAGSKRIIVMPIMFREGNAALPPGQRHITDPDVIFDAQVAFNSYATEYNRIMRQACMDGDGSIVFHEVQGLKRQWGSYLFDGLHFNMQGMTKYWRNVRKELILQAFKGRHN